jgi:predicted DNA-binding transcriptional regulator YafY
MANRPSSEDQLGRILQLLPLAAANSGVRLEELARRLGRSETEIFRDLGEVMGLAFIRPAGEPDDVSVLIEQDRVEVWTKAEFKRPPRLNRREALALSLAFRTLSAAQPDERRESDADREAKRPRSSDYMAGSDGGMAGSDGGASATTYAELAARLEERLTSKAPEVAPTAPIEIETGVIAPSETHDRLVAAARDRRRCRILYLSSGATEPQARDIDPYAVLIGGGRWYVVGYCHMREEVRVFRVDRVLEAQHLDHCFDIPDDFDAGAYVLDGRVYRAEEFEEVVIRYSPRIARWIEEHGPVETLADGSVQVRYSVADPRWAVRHVLEHAPEAEVVSPARIREMVRAAAATVARPPT